MRIAVMGTGGVGGYFGARLAEAGTDVAFVARGAHLAAIRERGLRVESELGDVHLAGAEVTDDPAEIGPVDLVLFAVKLWDTESAARAIAPMVGPDTWVVSFQNGVQKDEALRAAVGAPAVVGGVCYIAATIAEPGLIRHTGKLQKLVFGEYDTSRSPRVEELLAACREAEIDAEISADVRRAIWEKFVFLASTAGVTAATRRGVGAVRSNPRTRALLLDAMREVVAVGRAEGVELAEDFPEDRLAFCDQLPPEMTSSMHRDLERGNRLEVAWLSGDVVMRGAAAGVPTPVHRALSDLLELHADGTPQEAPGGTSPGSLARTWLRAWERHDMDLLRRSLAPDFVHTSPFGRFEGAEEYLRIVEPMSRKSVLGIRVKDVLEGKHQAAITYELETPAGKVESCDWVWVEDGRIREVNAYYDSTTNRAALEGGGSPVDGTEPPSDAEGG